MGDAVQLLVGIERERARIILTHPFPSAALTSDCVFERARCQAHKLEDERFSVG